GSEGTTSPKSYLTPITEPRSPAWVVQFSPSMASGSPITQTGGSWKVAPSSVEPVTGSCATAGARSKARKAAVAAEIRTGTGMVMVKASLDMENRHRRQGCQRGRSGIEREEAGRARLPLGQVSLTGIGEGEHVG